MLHQIEGSMACTGKARYDQMMNLIVWLKKECGIDFVPQGHRFGNYEHYQNPDPSMHFDIEYDNVGFHSIAVRRSEGLARACVVNCSLSGRGRWMNNQVGMLAAGETTLTFIADEPISCAAVQVWDRETSQLVFTKMEKYYDSLHMTGRIISSYQFKDTWSKELMKSASNLASIIESAVETIPRSSPWIDHKVVSPTHNAIDDAIQSSSNLFAEYAHDTFKGAFIQHFSKDGEIYSYIKIKEYIEAPTVEKVIIADPFFSIDAAEKILCRIGRTDVQIEIITTDNIMNPDSDGKQDQSDQSNWNTKHAFEAFIERRKRVVHKNLMIHILSRGNKHVFHDRYLIQHHADGSIRGYLLSNSLNSMGQFYPFVIAPMDHKTCLSVCEYLDRLCDPAIQNECRKAERIYCDTVLPMAVATSPAVKQRYDTLAPWYDDKGDLVIPKIELTEVVTAVMVDEKLSPQQQCRALSEISTTHCDWISQDLANVLQSYNNAAEIFLTAFPEEAAQAEEEEENDHPYVHDAAEPVDLLRELLCGKEKLNLGEWNKQLEYFTHIFYTKAAWLSGGYRLMLAMDPLAYVALLEKLCSPLMFMILAVPLMVDPHLEHFYHSLACSNNHLLRMLAAECMFRFVDKREWNMKQVAKILEDVPPEKRVLHTAYLLSRIKYRMRAPRRDQIVCEVWRVIYQDLLSRTAEALALCHAIDWKQVLQHLFEYDVCSRCQIVLDLADTVKKDSPLQKDLYQRAFRVIRDGLLDKHQPQGKDLTQHLSLYLIAIEKGYGEKAEKEMLGDNKTISWSVFDIATEPALRNYRFKEWQEANMRAKWQMKLLHDFWARHPEAEKTAEWIAEWEKRMSCE